MDPKMMEELLEKQLEALLVRHQPQPIGHREPPRPLTLRHLRIGDRVDGAELMATRPGRVLWGKYFICQTISGARRMGGLQLAVREPNAKGAWLMGLDLYNYSSFDKPSALGCDLDDILPPGSFLVLKNPAFNSVGGGLRCDNPSEVELVSRKALEAKFPDLIGKGQLEKETSQLFWDKIEGDEAAFGKLKGLGNIGFVDKRFSDALRFYDMALDYCAGKRGDEAMIHSNKSAALLALGCYNAALECAEVALEVDPGNEKYNYRKTKALIGLRKYEKALSFLQKKFDQFSSLAKSKDCKTLLENVKFLAERANIGPTQFQLFSIRMETMKDDAKLPEFTGPVEISEIEGKGRGLIASEDIYPGQLLICAKAFAYHALPPSSSSNKLININSLFETQQIIGKIANKLAFDPEIGAELYNLTGGAELCHLEPGDDDARLGYVDMARIKGIVKTNAFGSGKVSLKNEESNGLWILPSFINHSCSEFNCLWFICGEWMTITAIAEIKKGEELTVSYISPLGSYESRMRTCKNLGFACSCALCQLEAKEPISIKNEREKILQSLEELRSDCGPDEIKGALNEVEALVLLRKEHVSLNFPMLSPQIFRLTEILLGKGRIGDSISVLNRMNEVASSSVCWSTFGMNVTVNLLVAHAVKRDKKMVKLWKAKLVALVMKLFGSLEYSGIPFEALKEQFGIDFFE